MYKMIPIFVGICKNSRILPSKFYTIYFNRKKVCVCVGGGGWIRQKKQHFFIAPK